MTKPAFGNLLLDHSLWIFNFIFISPKFPIVRLGMFDDIECVWCL